MCGVIIIVHAELSVHPDRRELLLWFSINEKQIFYL